MVQAIPQLMAFDEFIAWQSGGRAGRNYIGLPKQPTFSIYQHDVIPIHFTISYFNFIKPMTGTMLCYAVFPEITTHLV